MERKPNVKHFRVFGCLAYVLVRDEKRKAFESHTQKCVFVGYPIDKPGSWTFWDASKQKFFDSSHAQFDERVIPGNTTNIKNPFDDFITPSVPTKLHTDVPIPPEVPRRGGETQNTDHVTSDKTQNLPPPLTPTSPLLPEVQTPPMSPLSDLPPHMLSATLSPSPSPNPVPTAPPRAKYEPRFRRDGLIEPLPDTGRGQRRAQVPVGAEKPPWNYQGTWNSPDDPTQNIDDDHNANISEAEVMAGVAYACEEFSYFTPSEAMEFAFLVALEATTPTGKEPKTLAEALALPSEEAAKWRQAAEEEMGALIDNGVFELVRLPPGRKAIGCRWVFKVKHNADGSIERYKARLVIKGYSQRPGFDFTETFSPTPKWATIRTILALAALDDLELHSVDISSAFLNGDLDEEIYMEEPEGFQTKDKTWAYRLQKSLYGLKQAGRQWHQKLHSVLTSMGFERVRCEHSVWVYQKDQARVIVPVFVDDMTIAAKSQTDINRVVEDLKRHFKLRDLGPTSYLLGVEIQRDRKQRQLTLSQKQYILNVLDRASMSDCNPVSTPLDPSEKLSAEMAPKTRQEWEEMRTVPYVNILGAVAYIAIATRPDIAYAVSVLARFSKDPGPKHWKALKHLLRYLRGTIDYKLTYAPDPTSNDLFTSYCDADHGGNPDNGRSTSGFIVKIGTGAVSWMSRLQSFVTLSTTEAEYVAAVSLGQEVLWLRNLLEEIGYKQDSPSTLRIDNQSALSVAKNLEHHSRVKHLDLRFYWLRDEVERRRLQVQHISTEVMPADALLKALGRERLQKLARLIGLECQTPRVEGEC
jgi:hypothetical protein